jgi:hypothetical protein
MANMADDAQFIMFAGLAPEQAANRYLETERARIRSLGVHR